MDLDRLAVRLRPRSDWEAVDLGFTMIRSWWRPVFAAWLVIALPPALVLILPFSAWGLLAFWWLLPLWEAATLVVISRTVFGDAPSTPEVVRRTPGTWRRLLPEVLWRRLHPGRSFQLPVSLLEGSAGGARSQRLMMLNSRRTDVPFWLTLTFVLFQVGLTAAAVSFLVLMTPSWLDPDWQAIGQQMMQGRAGWALTGLCLLAAAVVLVLNPFYIAAGFCIYLNRRTDLEGWDLEIAFRRMARRVRKIHHPRESPPGALAGERQPPGPGRTAAGVGVAGLVAAALTALTALPSPAAAQERGAEHDPPAATSGQPSASEVITEVMAREELRTTVTEERWQLRDDLAAPNDKTADHRTLPRLAPDLGLARFFEYLLWLGAGVLVILMLRELWRAVPKAAPPRKAVADAPERVLGLDLRQSSLPADIPGQAEALWRQGRQVEALSLLYRGALSGLHQEGLELRESFTELDCLEQARRHLTSERAGFFASLTGTWQSVAYAHRQPTLGQVTDLCHGWRKTFAATAGEAARR